MFSSRTNWPPHPNKLSQNLERRRNEGKPIYDLTVSNPTDCGFIYPGDEILGALAHVEALRYRPEAFGMHEAREAVAGYYASKNVNVSPSHIVLTTSTSEAYGWLLMLLCDAGDNVLVPMPAYPLFEHLARSHDVELRAYHLQYDGVWRIEFDSLQKAATTRTRACIVVSPHNPTGMVLTNDELDNLNAVVSARNVALVVDEVFSDYTFVGKGGQIKTTAKNDGALTFTLNGISKSCGLPQMKLGWIVLSGPEGQRQEALQRLELLADTFLSVNMPVQVALAQLLGVGERVRQQIQERLRRNHEFLRDATAESAVSLLNVEAGWYAILNMPRILADEEWALRLLNESGVYVFPGYYFDFDQQSFLVLSLLTTPEVFQRGVAEILTSTSNSL